MELCDLTLHNYIQGALPPEIPQGSLFFDRNRTTLSHVWSIMKDIANGLCFIHGLGELHGDLKPSNGIRLANQPNRKYSILNGTTPGNSATLDQ